MAADSAIKTADAKAVPADPGTVSVVVNAHYQVAHAGIVYRPNEIVEIPEDIAAQWIVDELVSLSGPAK